MIRRSFTLLLFATALFGLSNCGLRSREYSGPEVTSIHVNKRSRKMFLFHRRRVLKEYDIALGFSPVGAKRVEGDGKTPEGTYYIDRHNPNSKFHKSLGISYPNEKDVKRARALGKGAGGDIFIHGQPNTYDVTADDWTWGCIAVENHEMDEIYWMVRKGTPVTIRA
ncbi:MAG: L,D-transpeptidase family protein [Aestuariivita sp.]|nr:L,D-transpeptidase family protein [Aestuariivita sp.]